MFSTGFKNGLTKVFLRFGSDLIKISFEFFNSFKIFDFFKSADDSFAFDFGD